MTNATVVLTRPAGKYSGATELAGILESKGFRVRSIGVLEYVPLGAESLSSTINEVTNGSFEWIVFSSPIAVGVFSDLLSEQNSLPRTTKIAVQGPGTAQAVERYLRRNSDLTPSTYVAESLADALTKKLSKDSRVLHPCAKAGRDVVERELASKGIQVERVSTYETRPCALGDGDRVWLLDQNPGSLVFVFMSPSAVAACHAALLPLTPALLTQAKIVSVGPITSREIEKFGLPVTVESREHSEKGILEVLENPAILSRSSTSI